MNNKKKQLEELLNKLIEKWWKPFNMKSDLIFVNVWPCNKTLDTNVATINYWYDDRWIFQSLCFDRDSINDLILDSGLWEFVCLNGLYNRDMEDNLIWIAYDSVIINKDYILKVKHWKWLIYNNSVPEHRKMLSTIAEDRVQFILDNINL